jgi:hypothetical protein
LTQQQSVFNFCIVSIGSDTAQSETDTSGKNDVLKQSFSRCFQHVSACFSCAALRLFALCWAKAMRSTRSCLAK